MIKFFIILFWLLYVFLILIDLDNLFFKLVEYSAIFALCVHFMEYLFFFKRISKNVNYFHGFLMTMVFGFEYIRGLRK